MFGVTAGGTLHDATKSEKQAKQQKTPEEQMGRLRTENGCLLGSKSE